jgi:uncharacterized protein
MIACIRLYQVGISPLLGPCCRFSPSCSHYAVACIHDHGALRGGWLTVRRLLRCHPWHPGGLDLPPPPRPRQLAARLSSSRVDASSSLENC